MAEKEEEEEEAADLIRAWGFVGLVSKILLIA